MSRWKISRNKILGRTACRCFGKLERMATIKRSRQRGEGIFAKKIYQMFHIARRKVGLPEDGPELSTAAFCRPEGSQLALGL